MNTEWVSTRCSSWHSRSADRVSEQLTDRRASVNWSHIIASYVNNHCHHWRVWLNLTDSYHWLLASCWPVLACCEYSSSLKMIVNRRVSQSWKNVHRCRAQSVPLSSSYSAVVFSELHVHLVCWYFPNVFFNTETQPHLTPQSRRFLVETLWASPNGHKATRKRMPAIISFLERKGGEHLWSISGLDLQFRWLSVWFSEYCRLDASLILVVTD